MLLTLALGVSALAGNAPDWVVGSYRLELTPDLKEAAQKLGVPEPYARIMLRPDGTFSYASNNAGNISGTNGTFELTNHDIRLIASDKFPVQNVKTLSGKASENALDINGLHYVKAGVDPVKPNAAPVPNFDMTGTWHVRSGDQLDRSIKMVFKDNHTFEFACIDASSKGRFDIDGNKLTLTWTEVDGTAVEAGRMKKVVNVHDDGSFFIDTYQYVKG